MSASNDASPVSGASPTEAIIEAVAEREGVNVTDVEPPAYDPLYAVVDPEALDALFRGTQTTVERVVLEYEGYEVVLHADGRVVLTDLGASDDAVGRPVRD